MQSLGRFSVTKKYWRWWKKAGENENYARGRKVPTAAMKNEISRPTDIKFYVGHATTDDFVSAKQTFLSRLRTREQQKAFVGTFCNHRVEKGLLRNKINLNIKLEKFSRLKVCRGWPEGKKSIE